MADEDGNWDWSRPDEEVHAAVNELERPIGTHLYGRRMYEVLSAWEHPEEIGDEPEITEYGEIWKAADKVVYSRSLDEVTTTRTRLEREFDPAAVREMKESAERDISIGGPGIAAHALEAGLVDELHLIVSPVIVGGGTRALPDGLRLDLELVGERRFANGVVHLHYRLA